MVDADTVNLRRSPSGSRNRSRSGILSRRLIAIPGITGEVWLRCPVRGNDGRMREPRALIEELFRRQRAADERVLDDLVAEDMVNHAAGPQGRDGLRQILDTIHDDL